jgi:hypothetical protein
MRCAACLMSDDELRPRRQRLERRHAEERAGARASAVVEADRTVALPRLPIGADATSAPLLLFLNPDARPQPGSLARLRAVADERPEWAAWQPAVMLPDGRINTAGGVVHYLGLSWAVSASSRRASWRTRPTTLRSRRARRS